MNGWFSAFVVYKATKKVNKSLDGVRREAEGIHKAVIRLTGDSVEEKPRRRGLFGLFR